MIGRTIIPTISSVQLRPVHLGYFDGNDRGNAIDIYI